MLKCSNIILTLNILMVLIYRVCKKSVSSMMIIKSLIIIVVVVVTILQMGELRLREYKEIAWDYNSMW